MLPTWRNETNNQSIYSICVYKYTYAYYKYFGGNSFIVDFAASLWDLYIIGWDGVWGCLLYLWFLLTANTLLDLYSCVA